MYEGRETEERQEKQGKRNADSTRTLGPLDAIIRRDAVLERSDREPSGRTVGERVSARTKSQSVAGSRDPGVRADGQETPFTFLRDFPAFVVVVASLSPSPSAPSLPLTVVCLSCRRRRLAIRLSFRLQLCVRGSCSIN